MSFLVVNSLRAFVQSLNFGGAVTSATFDGTSTVLSVPDVYHATAGDTIQINGGDVTLTAVDFNNCTFTALGDLSAATSYSVPAPKFWHGTPYLTNAELSKIRDGSAKYPAVYLSEIIREEVGNFDTPFVTTADVRLHFIHEANVEDWLAEDYYRFVIPAMRNLADQFRRSAIDSGNFGPFTSTFINHAPWGLYADQKGHISSIFNDKLAGVELRASLPFFNCPLK